jgi:membrane-associated protease RseP (regulator of RpoE activity)|tara:strand:+ start:67 stop:864 length:798 start_codon:yes stop_codon:yes gene_type:complete
MLNHIPRRQLLLHFFLFVATLITTFLAGGLAFGVTLILILGAHEMGHYLMTRKWGVSATLPYFIPAPPPFIAGTFGAFIKMKSPIPNRRVLLEIGAAGPIAGFVVCMPALIIGLTLSEIREPDFQLGFSFGSSIVLSFLSKMVLGASPADVNIVLHPIAFAGWIGLFITALNLLPIGQLDGGHIVYALFEKKYQLVSKITFIILIPLGYFLWHGWFIWAAIVAVFGFRHPPLMDESIPLTSQDKKIGLISIAIFVVTFIPAPIIF